jgi:hypothetical protein
LKERDDWRKLAERAEAEVETANDRLARVSVKVVDLEAALRELRTYAEIIEKAYIREVGINRWHREFGEQAAALQGRCPPHSDPDNSGMCIYCEADLRPPDTEGD